MRLPTAALLISLALTACGTKGPLTIPEPAKKAAATTPATNHNSGRLS